MVYITYCLHSLFKAVTHILCVATFAIKVETIAFVKILDKYNHWISISEKLSVATLKYSVATCGEFQQNCFKVWVVSRCA
jgi:hypothetical protein